MIESIRSVLATLVHCFKTATFMDLFEIIFIAVVVYKMLSFIHNTSVGRVIRGILWLLVVMQLSDWLQLNVIFFIMRNTMQIGLIALLIMFQPEIRHLLEQVGTGNLQQIFDRGKKADSVSSMIAEVVDACSTMSWAHTGALIVFQRTKPINEVVTAATQVDACVTSELVKNIFFKNSPLHDGAMVIIGSRIAYAGCVLPLTENNNLSKELGTRHRAGIGITEKTDATSLIVSEETGSISVAVNGELTRGLTAETLSSMLIALIGIPEEQKKPTGTQQFTEFLKRVLR